MDDTTHTICQATNRFYAEHAASFASTRQQAWQGWERLLPHLAALPQSFTVLDAACGNLRFEQFLTGHGLYPAAAYAVDACPELLAAPTPDAMQTERVCADLIEMLDAGHDFGSIGVPACDLAVCFGFLHHLPRPDLRRRMVEALLGATKPGGLCIISLWQFGKDERLAKKARHLTAAAEQALSIVLDDDADRFLGWQDAEEAFRFCHDFSDAECAGAARFTEEHGARVLSSFCADGKTGDLNRYLVLQVV